MKSLRSIRRRIVPWFLGLYFVAQIAGIALLTVVHFQHAYQSQVAVAADLAWAGMIDHGHEHDGHHQHGTAHPGDQCCALHHHLAAVFSFELTADAVDFTRILLALPLPDLLVGAETGLPDRPPKLLLSV